MKKNLLKYTLIIASFIVSSCSPSSPSCDPDFEDCTSLVSVKMDDDKNKNYVMDPSSTNEKGSVNYEIFIRSFYDSDGDGIGDFNGVKEKLPYLKELGVKDIWLMPFNKTNSYHGYDVVSYYDVNPDYGSIDDLIALVNEAKKYNIGIVMDLVLNHSSKFNPWFNESYNDYYNGVSGEFSKADWYVWSFDALGGYHKYRDLYYEGDFDSSMPDFNLSSPSLRDEIKKIVKYWIDLGIKGFRLDAVLYYYYNSHESNITFLKWLNDYIKSINEDVYLVGECWTDNQSVNEYYTSGAESFFDFGSSIKGNGYDSIIGVAKGTIGTKSFSSFIESKENVRKENNPKGYSSYFLSNHDMDRVSKNCYGEYAKAVASCYLLLPGTPYIYYGEEIEMVGERCTSPDDRSDVKRRLPMVWSKNDATGKCKFPEQSRKDLDNTKQVENGVNDMLKVNYSLINHYKKVINVRNKYPFIKHSYYKDLSASINGNERVLAYELSLNDERIVVVQNFNSVNVEIDVSNVANTILDSINTAKKVPTIKDGKLKIGAFSTVILN